MLLVSELPDSRQPSDAILTVPNLLTFLRIGIVPLFLWLALGRENLGLAVAAAFLGIATDLLDGRIARRYGQISRLGIALDPLSDRLGIAAAAVVLIVKDLAPVWAVLAVIVRDGLLLLGAPALKARGISIPPVSKVGKYGSFAVTLSFGVFLASGIADVDDPSRALQAVAWTLFAVGIPLYYAAGLGYVRAALVSLREKEGPG